MPLVQITGFARDHGLEVLPTSREQRLWFVPNMGHMKPSAGALDGRPVAADFNRSTGAFSVDVWSTLEPDLWYYLRTDWLTPISPGSTEEVNRGFFQWPQRIFPDTGGELGDLIEQQTGLGLVYCAPDVVNTSRRNQLQYNTGSHDLYERVVTWL